MSEFASKEFFEHLMDGVCAIDMTGKVIFINPSAYSILGIRKNDIIGETIWHSIPYIPSNDALIQLLIDTTYEKTESHEAVVDYYGGYGHIKKIRVCVSYSEKNGGCMFFVFTDLTELFRVNSIFSRYLSRDIANVVLNSNEESIMGGNLRNITCLMSDLRGFTAMSESLPPERVVTLLNHYFEKMNQIVEAHHGVLDDIMGDGMLIEFGITNEDDFHADNALLCALDMQAAMEEINQWNDSQQLPRISMGIGINTGDAIVGNIGSVSRTKFTCIGRTVNLSSRIEGYTKGGQILIAESTLEALNGKPEIIDTQAIRPKGIGRDVMVYDIASYKIEQ